MESVYPLADVRLISPSAGIAKGTMLFRNICYPWWILLWSILTMGFKIPSRSPKNLTKSGTNVLADCSGQTDEMRNHNLRSSSHWYHWFIQPFPLSNNCRKVQTRSSKKVPPSTQKQDKRHDPKVKDKPGFSAGYSVGTLRRKQDEDPDISPVLKWMSSGARLFGVNVCATSPATRHYWNTWNQLSILQGVLYRRFTCRNDTGDHYQLIVPSSLQNDVIHQMHCTRMSGHLGRKKTREKALQQYYWFGIRSDINNYVRCCDTCAANKAPPRTPKAPIGDMRTGAPMDRLATDILGPFPTTVRGNRYVLVVTDHFTNWVEIIPVPDQTAETTAHRILTEVICRFGCPLDIHSDQGANYRSNLFQELCKLLEV